MELVIPGVALGLLYVVTNQNKNKENFRSSQLPNVDIPNTNYPSEYPVTSPELDQTSQLSTNNGYDNTDGTYTDKYFNPNMNDSLFTKNNVVPLSGNSTEFYSLTGDKVNSSYFQHY